VGIDTPLYPVGLVVEGRRCLVVGGGRVAARKVSGLLYCGAAVTMVAPAVHVALHTLMEDGTLGAIDDAPLDVHLRPYRPGEAANYRLVVTATGVPEVDRAVHADAERAGVWVNAADDPDHCSFVLPSVHRDGPVSVAVSTGGASPALAAWVRRRAAEAIGPGLGRLAALLNEERTRVRAEGRSTESVDWAALLDGPLPALVRSGRVAEARALVRQATLVATSVDARAGGGRVASPASG
jgi:siroheme synthase-like protein